MTTTLWSKGYTLEPSIARFEAVRNAALDGQLASYDIWGSLAHARMLRHVGLLDEHDWRALHQGLVRLLASADDGSLLPAPDEEDIHTAVEHRLVEQIGTPAKMLHTGRSRNDQVLVDLRLYAKEALPRIAVGILDTSAALLTRARELEWLPMPGYTHMQRGMLSSAGLWAAAHAEALLDDLIALEAVYRLNDQSPLGSAAAYGAPLPLDRLYTAQLLGFAGTHHNVLTAANARGKIEAATVQTFALVMLDLSKWAQDVLLFTTSEYGFFSAPDELCDGSSIMPQKHNLSALELVRARAQTVIALQSQMLATLAGLPSGYNMDYQETKAPLIETVHICLESLGVVGLYASQLIVHRERMEAACTAELFATDRAYALAAQGVPFRDAYRTVAADPAGQLPGRLIERLHERTAEGAPGNLQLDVVAERIARERAAWERRAEQLERAIAALVEAADPPSHPFTGHASAQQHGIHPATGSGFDHDQALALGI
jgi:argininosuccinate lyase